MTGQRPNLSNCVILLDSAIRKRPRPWGLAAARPTVYGHWPERGSIGKWVALAPEVRRDLEFLLFLACKSHPDFALVYRPWEVCRARHME